jgi:hypothetical protein
VIPVDPTISALLAARGYGHRKDPSENACRTVFRLSDGEVIGSFSAGAAVKHFKLDENEHDPT